MKKVSGSLKLTYSQYRELQSFSQFGSDLDKDTKERLALGERVVEVLKQDRNSPIAVENQVLIIYAVTHNYLKDIAVSDVLEFQNEMFDFIAESHPDITETIRTQKVLTPEAEDELKDALNEFVKKFLAEKA